MHFAVIVRLFVHVTDWQRWNEWSGLKREEG